ncbi:hypothetical protein I3500192B8_09220 [Acidaminococcus intestini]
MTGDSSWDNKKSWLLKLKWIDNSLSLYISWKVGPTPYVLAKGIRQRLQQK